MTRSVERAGGDRYRGAVSTIDPPPPARARCIALVGPMGAGKSTVAARLAARTGRRLVDLDEVIERDAGRTIAELFATDGEPAFRERERLALTAALDGVEPTVVATGGGVVVDPVSRQRLRHGATVVWLSAPASVLVDRIGDTTTRPLLAGDDPTARLDQLIAERDPVYAEVAHHHIEVAGLGPDDVVDAILDRVGEAV